MKKIYAVIAEYNPFHNGHAYHIARTREEDAEENFVVAVMSGYFVQRGTAAVLPPAVRAQSAVANGVDLVLELPVSYSTASADYFAMGAIKVLNELGADITLSFGSETGDITDIIKVSGTILENENEMFELIRRFMSEGYSMPRARESALKALGATASGIMDNPNNILGVEYVKHAMRIMGERCRFKAVKRRGAGYHDDGKSDGIMSATGIRQQLFAGKSDWKDAVPPETLRSLIENRTVNTEMMFSMIKNAVIREGTLIKRYRDVVEGLENRIIQGVRLSSDYTGLVRQISTKRYTVSAIQRALLSILLAIPKKDFQENINSRLPYIRVLAWNERGRGLLGELRRDMTAPLIEQGRRFPWREWYASGSAVIFQNRLEERAESLYGMIPHEC